MLRPQFKGVRPYITKSEPGSKSKRPPAAFCSPGLPVFLLSCLAAVLGAGPSVAQEQSSQSLSLPPPSLWNAGVGAGFNTGTSELGISAGAGYGLRIFGSRVQHHWALGALRYGQIISDVTTPDHGCRGNWELAGELFGGEQYHPDAAYVAGLAPHLRYYFATGTRWVPFADLGAGVTATDIRNRDLSTTFEFNLNASIGTLYFLRDNLGLSLEARYLHLSNAGMDVPNGGVNTLNLFLGLAWFF